MNDVLSNRAVRYGIWIISRCCTYGTGGVGFAIVFLLIYSLYEAFLPYQIIEYMDELSHSDKIWVEKWVVLFSSRAVGTEYEILPSRRDSTIF